MQLTASRVTQQLLTAANPVQLFNNGLPCKIFGMVFTTLDAVTSLVEIGVTSAAHGVNFVDATDLLFHISLMDGTGGVGPSTYVMKVPFMADQGLVLAAAVPGNGIFVTTFFDQPGA